jgi:hypothetical protein
VLEQVMGLAGRCVVVPLRGNYEGMVLAALKGQPELRYRLGFGGTEAAAGISETTRDRAGDARCY